MLDALARLGALRDKGILTEEEFAAKPVAATVNRWAFAALVGGNLALSLTAMVP